jgi:tRNA pseudouridine32 synthase / 23S rRNA pseudouridine746 synthase
VCDSPAPPVNPRGTACRMSPVIVHVDASIVVIDKPAGMLAVPGRREPRCAWSEVVARYADALVVHRLDQATSGLMLLARGAAMQRALSIAFAERRVDKRYEAIVHRVPDADQGRIELPLAADWPNRPRRKIDADHGKPAFTAWRVLERDVATDRARLRLTPLTGRTHQLRVHLTAIGHPIVGDALYGTFAGNATRMLLHATHLAFHHPLDGMPQVFECPAPF